MRENSYPQQIQKHELRLGIEELVKSYKPKFNEEQIFNRTNWLLSLVLGTARAEAIRTLAEYRKEKLSPSNLLKEKHNSSRLGAYLNAAGKSKPDCVYEAHAIVSGKHKSARAARRILARYNIRVDDPDNGIWLPNFKRHVPHEAYPDAPAHRIVHTHQYYINVTDVLRRANSEEETRAVLNKIGARLQEGRFPFLKNQRINRNNW